MLYPRIVPLFTHGLLVTKDPRISIGIPIIGSPDYHTLLNHRATHTPPPLGPLALTPPLYPAALRTFVDQHDPVNVPLSNWTGKKLLICSGATDQLVNYVDGGAERFVNVLKKEGVLIDVFVQEGWSVFIFVSRYRPFTVSTIMLPFASIV